MKTYEHVLSFCLDHPWALTAPYRQIVATTIARRIVGLGPDPAQIEIAAARRDQAPAPRRGGNVAVIPVHGVIVPRAALLFEASGLVSLDSLLAQIRAAVADPEIRTIALDIDSPGGSVAGCPEFCAELLALRQQKPIIAVARYTMCSAAYWIAACATEIVASPSAQVGSVGVYTIHDDVSEALAQLGIKRTYIFAGKHKVDGNEAEPLTKEVEAEIKRKVMQAYDLFVSDVAKGRGVPIGDVRNGYGEGRTLYAAEAKAEGMVDNVETLDERIARLTPKTVIAAAGIPDGAHAYAVILTAGEPADAAAADAAWQNDAFRSIAELSL